MRNLHRCGPVLRRLLTQSNELAAGRTRQRMVLRQSGLCWLLTPLSRTVTAVWQSRISSPTDGWLWSRKCLKRWFSWLWALPCSLPIHGWGRLVAHTSSAAQQALVCSGLKQAISLLFLGVSPSSVNADSFFWAQFQQLDRAAET
jgi:hypothetical protein